MKRSQSFQPFFLVFLLIREDISSVLFQKSEVFLLILAGICLGDHGSMFVVLAVVLHKQLARLIVQGTFWKRNN